MADFFFYLFSAFTVGSALLAVINRNPVNAAMFLLLTFVGMASLFVLLEAYFLAALQVLVYAGAVVVLFLFIIMLLDVPGEQRRRFRKSTAAGSVIALLLLGAGVLILFGREIPGGVPASPLPAGGELRMFGQQLFTTYLLPMQVTGFLLLIAMIGIIVLSKRGPGEEEVE